MVEEKNEKLEEFGSGVQYSEKNELTFCKGCSYNFDLEDLLSASADFLVKGVTELLIELLWMRLIMIPSGADSVSLWKITLFIHGNGRNPLDWDARLKVSLGAAKGIAHIHSEGHEDVVNLPRWVRAVVREEWTAEVFDIELMKYQNIQEEMVQMLQIGLSCVTKVPDMRPSMVEVIKMIEEIKQL
ncbi:hypothetical protein T459_16356 [Capsicum annuum]|uniref:Uncharacterized protein n=1 Tax=Capsicum annuum TaxID=4072 RepID=A0A2G2Z8K8_CAPAN|nr:hypothetical protein T459_16356 [Capsicum annuum]